MPSIVYNHHRRKSSSCDVLKYLKYAIVMAAVVFIVLITTLSSTGGANSSKKGIAQKQQQQQQQHKVYPDKEQFNPVVPQDDDFYNKGEYDHDDDAAADAMMSNAAAAVAAVAEDTDPATNFVESKKYGKYGTLADPNILQSDQNHPFVEQHCDMSIANSNTSDVWWPSDHSWKTRTPYFLLIGAKKGGTSSLASWLNRHPLIEPPRTKELLSFLPNRMQSSVAIDEITNQVLVHNIRTASILTNDYHIERLQDNDALITFEATPGYLLHSTWSRIAIACVMPWTKLLVTLRHPVDRAFSNYNFLLDARMKRIARTAGLDSNNNNNNNNNASRMPGFDIFVQQDMNLLKQAGVIGDKAAGTTTPQAGSVEEQRAWTIYQGMIGNSEAPVGRSLYVLQLQEWFAGLRELGRDPESEVLVVRNEDMKKDPDAVYQTILWWLELPSFTPPMGYNSQMVTQYRSPPMSNETKHMLEQFYKPYNKRLFDLLGWDQDVWEHKTEAQITTEQQEVEEDDQEEEEEVVREENMDSIELAHIYDPPNYDEVRGTNFTNQWCVLDQVSWYPPPNKIWQLRAPYFILPGAKKSGTTALAFYLTQHPNIQPARSKELQFFLNKNFRIEYVNNQRQTHVRQARDHLYSMEFNSMALKRNNSLISMDATPGYLFFSAMLPQRILCVTPWIKLVVILRNPVDRAFSNWAFSLRRNGMSSEQGPSFEKFVKQDMAQLEDSGFLTATTPEEEAARWPTYLTLAREGPIGRSMYEIQLRQWFQAIRDIGRDPKTQVYIVRSEDLKKDVPGEMKKVYHFLGLDDVPVANEQERVVSHYSAPMANETRAKLEEFFAPYNKRLYDLLLENGFGEDWMGFWDPK